MKFTNGYWLKRAGWDVRHPKHYSILEERNGEAIIVAPTKEIKFKGAELDTPHLTVSISPLAEGIIKVKIEHHQGYLLKKPEFVFHPEETGKQYQKKISVDSKHGRAEIESGVLKAVFGGRAASDKNNETSPLQGWDLRFYVEDKEVTRSTVRSVGLAFSPTGQKYLHEQLVIQPGELIYGLGERFGPVVKNGQTVDIWNADGGTASEQAYKNIPFYWSNRGYGVLVNHPELVSFEVGSEVNSRVQFSVEGDKLEYLVIAGPTPKDVLRRYTALTGRPPLPPAWSYGLWLSTSFKTDYSEDTVNQLVDEMVQQKLPLRVLHFDCYWMRANRWCDFTWDPDLFPNPQAMLKRYHDRGLKICVWINPYIAQQSTMFQEGKEKGYLLHTASGAVKQWDHWQSGMAWVDFTNPQAKAWYQAKLRQLLKQGVDCFKTDFGERIPAEDVKWFDNSDPSVMHNYYSYLYNQAVYEVIVEERGQEEALVFARSATVGGQKFPTHWGGDSEPTFESMGETLRGGLSLSNSGFAYWSHDMGGFEGKPDPAVFTRWFPFGMLSTHSRLHGSDSFRTPWTYGQAAVECAQRFIALKHRLVPYLWNCAKEAQSDGIPVMRHLALEFPDDLGSANVETQYCLGPNLLVAPVFSYSGQVNYYLPTAGWTSLLDGHRVEEPGWQREVHDFNSLPVMVPDGAIVPVGSDTNRPDYDWADGIRLYFFGKKFLTQSVEVMHGQNGKKRQFKVKQVGQELTITDLEKGNNWSICLVGNEDVAEILEGETVEDGPYPGLAPGFCVTPNKAGIIRLRLL